MLDLHLVLTLGSCVPLEFRSYSAHCWSCRYPGLTVSEELPNGCFMDWNYWGTGHGKGPHDGAGACLKQALRKEQLKIDSVKLQNAQDVVQFLNGNMNVPHAAYPKARQPVNRHFHLIGLNEVSRERPLACNTVKGSVRSVSHTNNVLLECRDFCCFCPSCARRSFGACPNRAHVAPWKLITLQPITSTDAVQESEEQDPDWETAPDDNVLALECAVGDHFAIVADPNTPNEGGATFYVLLCTTPMYTVRGASVTDAWNTTVDEGDEVIEGYYYRQQGRSPHSYVLLRDVGVAQVYSHLVCATKFTMTLAPHKQKGGVSVYQLSDSAAQHIATCIKGRQLQEDLNDADDDGGLSNNDSESGSDDNVSDVEDSDIQPDDLE